MQGTFYSWLLLLKAQASAMTGNLQAAQQAVQSWEQQPEQQLPLPSELIMPSRRTQNPGQWGAAWSACSAAKDKANEQFRKGNFAGD